MNWSTQQQAVFNWFETGVGHLVVRARAGTGKTTTIVEGINRAPEAKILLCAFNKRIAEELNARLSNGNATAKTLHAIGYACVRRYWENLRIASGSERADALAARVCSSTAPDAMKRLVAKLCTLGREIAPHARKVGDLTDIAWQFECVPDENWAADGFDDAWVEQRALQAMDLAAREKPQAIDFADMIYLPIRNKWLAKWYDLVVVDEAQDMTVAQLEIAQGVCKGRICVVGDDRQAIYGFRGADSGSLDRLKAGLDAAELGLTVTYRCRRAIVQLAAEIVPDFTCGDGVADGEVRVTDAEKLVDEIPLGAFLLSRKNAPLVSVAMALLRSGKRARVAGRDIGAGLKALVRKLKARTVPELIARLRAWETREATRFEKAGKDAKADAVHDQAETLLALLEGAKNVSDIEGRVDALFTDDGLGQAGVVTCSSVHRAKGLEADTVYVLADTLRSGQIEEDNIRYVAITRAKTLLVWVAGVK